MNIEKELKSIKDILRTYIKALQTKTRLNIKLSSRIIKGQALKLLPTCLMSVCAHKHNPNHGNKSNIQYMMENKSEIETKRIIVKENIV